MLSTGDRDDVTHALADRDALADGDTLGDSDGDDVALGDTDTVPLLHCDADTEMLLEPHALALGDIDDDIVTETEPQGLDEMLPLELGDSTALPDADDPPLADDD